MRRDLLARALAMALLDGDWEAEAMVERVRETFGVPRALTPMRALARAARATFAAPPRPEALAAWIGSQPALGKLAPFPVRHFATPAPEMRESPWRVPPLATTRELATWLGYDLDTIARLADPRPSAIEAACHYRYAWIAKPSGGQRLIEAPKPRLRIAQRRILDGIVAAIPPHDAAHGFRAGRSVIGFAKLHVGRAAVLRIDLDAFFPSVFGARVRGVFRTAGYPEEVARVLAALCTHRTPEDVLAGAPFETRARLRTPHLPQGAPTSGALANLAAYRLDVRLSGLAAKLGARYARYADDLVLSGDRTLLSRAPAVLGRVAAIAADEGFTVAFRKTRVMSAAGRQRVTGIVVNEKVAPSRLDYERLRAILHNCARTGPAAQNREGHADFQNQLRGRIAWIAQLDRAKGARLRAAFDRIVWE